jgi:Cytochrome c554 and c-prime
MDPPNAGDASSLLTREELMDPEQCKTCHVGHYDEWASSMHAYAADDPVFRAMNQRGQRETGGELGAFCVQCHAPMAVLTGATNDGLNLDDLPASSRG